MIDFVHFIFKDMTLKLSDHLTGYNHYSLQPLCKVPCRTPKAIIFPVGLLQDLDGDLLIKSHPP